MLKSLRLRLSLLYLLATLSLVALIGAGTYGLLVQNFQHATDLALQYKMATEFRLRGLNLPAELLAAEQAWLQDSPPQIRPSPTFTPRYEYSHESEDDDEGSAFMQGGSVEMPLQENEAEERYDGSLAPVFILPSLGSNPAPGVPVIDDERAVDAALQRGSDLRTVSLESGGRVRLLTYRANDGSILQVGRLLTDQDSLLSRYLLGLLILGSAASLLLALMSWGLAGRSIKPVQRAWNQQQAFVANASHELRSPLTLIQASADYGLRSSSGGEREQALHDIVNECNYMNRLVEDLLLLSRIDARRLNLSFEVLPVIDLLANTIRQVEKIARGKGVVITLDPASGSVRGDPLRLRQVLLILLDNALRFTPAGGAIRLGAHVRGKWLSLYVADNGPGIPAQYLPHVFDRFYQVPEQSSEGRGNGLGLSIAKALIEMQHGMVSIDSSPGAGTVAWVRLPLA